MAMIKVASNMRAADMRAADMGAADMGAGVWAGVWSGVGSGVGGLGLCRRVSRGHHQTRYGNGRERIDADQRRYCQAARQESVTSIPGHFIYPY